MKIKAFEVRHVQRMELRPFDRLGLGAGGPQRLAALAEAYAGAGPAFTILHGGEAAACGGVAVQPGATGNAWMLTSPLVERIPVAVARAVRGRLAAIEKDHGACAARRPACVVSVFGVRLRGRVAQACG